MGLGGLLAKVDLDALKSDGLRRTVIGVCIIVTLAPFGWFELIEPLQIYWTILAVGGFLMGLPMVSVVQDTLKKVKEKP